MIVLDTSVWVGFFLSSDAHHSQTVDWFDSWTLHASLIHIPMLCLAELAGALGRQGVELPVIGQTIAELVHRDVYQLHDLDLSTAQFSASIAASAGLKGADAVFVALTASLGLPLVTWDRQQRERGAIFCRTMTPVEGMEMAG